MKRTPLKRATPLKATTGLKQGAPLKRATVLQRGGPLRKSALRASPPRQTNTDLAREFFDTVTTIPSRDERVRARCLMCGRRSGLDAHHVVPKQMLKRIARGLRFTLEQTDALVYDVRDGVPLCRHCHDLHEGASRRVPRSKLPAQVLAFVAYVDSLTGTQEAASYIERIYP